MTESKEKPGLTYVLNNLSWTAEDSLPYTLYPSESGILLQEIERLRGEVAHLQGERAAVVEYLRGLADDYGVCIDLSLMEQADKIERGEHRREEQE